MRGPHHDEAVATRKLPGLSAETALVVGLIALGTALRVQGITSHPLWIDEYGSWWAVAGDGLAELWRRVLTVHGQSPFFYGIVNASVGALGPTPLALRLPSLVFGIALLALALPLAQAAFGDRRSAIAALAAFAVNERLIFYSQEARPYALALFCAGLSCLAWLALLREPRSVRARAAYLLTTAACFYAHYLFGVLVLVHAVHWLVSRPQRADLGSWLATAGLLMALLTPGAFQLADLFGRREILDWVEPNAPLQLLGSYFDPAVLAWTAGTALLAVIVARGVNLPTSRAGTGFVVLWLAVPFLVITLLPPLFGISLLDRRYLAVALPAAPLLYGVLIALPARNAWLPLLVFLVASMALSLAPRYEATGLFSARYRGEHWDRAVQALRKGQPPGDPIFYATHFGELDAVVLGQASDDDREFSVWPVAAHLPPERRSSLRALPYRDSAEMLPALESRLDEASRVPRSWVIGKQPVIAQFIRMAVRRKGVDVVAHQRFGRIYLIQLRGRVDGGLTEPR